jgi:SagB-type dehydrogenase family enzyme
MTDEDDIRVARRYHEGTKHSVRSVQTDRHYLDWNIKPAVYKEYVGIDPLPLPVDLPETGVPALAALEYPAEEAAGESIPDLSQIAYLLYYSAGITKKLEYAGGEIHFRAAACAGALYPIEIYLVCGDLPGLAAGIYHFSPASFSLYPLRRGDFRSALASASGDEPAVRLAPAVLVYSAITWRSSWKYRARAYRYHFWDCGTILANNLAACRAIELITRLVMGFIDERVNWLLGIDGEDEKALALLPVGRTATAPPPSPEVTPLELQVKPISDEQVDYPLIDDLHLASSFVERAELGQWRQARISGGGEPMDNLIPLDPLDRSSQPDKSLEQVVVRRGSSRRFKREAISFTTLSTILTAGRLSFPADWGESGRGFLNQIYFNAHAVEGLAPGAYRFHPQDEALESLKEGDFRHHSAHMCLDQALGGTSSATIFFLADLEAVLEVYGSRGYRLAQMEAGLLGGKMYLGAYTLGIGATGLTFYDDVVVQFFTPEKPRNEAIFVVALGVPASPSGSQGRLVYTNPRGEPLPIR